MQPLSRIQPLVALRLVVPFPLIPLPHQVCVQPVDVRLDITQPMQAQHCAKLVPLSLTVPQLLVQTTEPTPFAPPVKLVISVMVLAHAQHVPPTAVPVPPLPPVKPVPLVISVMVLPHAQHVTKWTGALLIK